MPAYSASMPSARAASVHIGAVGVVDAPVGKRASVGRLDELVAAGEDGGPDHGAAGEFRIAETGGEADVASGEAARRGEEHFARPEDLALSAHVGAGSEACGLKGDEVVLHADLFNGNDGVETGGHGGARHDAQCGALGKGLFKRMASSCDAADGKLDGVRLRQVGRAQREAVHGRVVEMGEVELRGDAFGEDASLCLEQRHCFAGTVKRCDGLA